MKKLIITILLVSVTLPIFAQEIGIQLYSLRNQFKNDIEGTLKTIADWGIDTVEGGDTYGMDEADFRALLDRYNITVVGIGVDYNDLKKDLAAIADKADRYGSNYLMCPWIPHNGDEFTLEDTQQAIELFNKAGAYFKSRGLIFTYHIHGYEFRPHGEGTLFDLMAEQATDFDFEMDVYWVTHGGEDPMKLLNRYPDKFKLMHLKDMAKGLVGNDSGHEDVETNVTLGLGQIDIAGLVKRGKELGIEYMFIEDESSRVLEQVPQSLKYLKGL
ncbi:MAG: sugar phosphate isomerase/epimerase [Flavobacteriaceae bacterium]|nr:sugar phosphate isomerase/epimerase [Flavobacteriaceae bacterium]